MGTEKSRTQKTLLNARVNFLYILVAVVIGFYSRKIFLDSLGTEFLGLTSTLQGLLGFLSLAELGIGSAIAVNLFKPVADDDKDAVTEIVSAMAFIYKRIGLFIFSAGVVLSFFLPMIFHKADVSLHIVYFAYFSFLLASSASYFFTYKSTIFAADQRGYEISKFTQTAQILKLIIQIGLCYWTSNPYVWTSVEFLSAIVSFTILETRIRKIYPWFKVKRIEIKPLLKKYPRVKTTMKQVFVHKIISFMTSQTAPLLIYGYVSLTMVVLYANYTTITKKLTMFVNSILGSAESSVGNLVASQSVDEQLKVYKELTSLNFFVAGFFVFMLYVLINPFISIWLGSEYILGQTTVVIILAEVFISRYRGSTDEFLYGYGMFKDMWAPFVEGLIYIGGSLILGPKYGLNGVIFSLALSQYVMGGGWRPYFLFRWGFKVSYLKYVSIWLREILVVLFSIFTSLQIIKLFELNFNSYLQWFISAVIVATVYLAINIPAMYLFAPQFHFTFKRMKLIFKRILKK